MKFYLGREGLMNISDDPTTKKIGAYALELMGKKDEKINPIELQRQIHKGNKDEDSFENQVLTAIRRGRDQLSGDFYVVVLFKKERLLQNIVRQYFFPRKSCPTPEYDQVVYKYYRDSEKIEMLWVIPDKQSTIYLPTIRFYLPPEQSDLLRFIDDFNSGKLDELCEKHNRNL